MKRKRTRLIGWYDKKYGKISEEKKRLKLKMRNETSKENNRKFPFHRHTDENMSEENKDYG